ncbi:hypothetical protein [Leptonema illini]|nr:hypothetical protein [Leptonema illini]
MTILLFISLILCHTQGIIARQETLPQNRAQDCIEFNESILTLFSGAEGMMFLWEASYSERTASGDWPDYGPGLVCITFINAGGEQIPGEFIHYKGNVLYRLVVYEKPEYAVQAAATAFKRERTMVRGNRLFTYAVDQGNRKNVSPMILKAAEDFLNRQD